METSEFRPKLKQDSIFLPFQDGVVLRNGASVFSLKGQAIYRWLSTLAPHLTGEHTLEEMCESLEPARREMVVKLVTTLFEKGIVKNHVREEPDVLPEHVRERFRPQLELIDHQADSPGQKFAAFRQSRLLLAGAGESFKALARSLARNGLENIHLAPAGPNPPTRGELEVEISALESEGYEFNWTISPLDGIDVSQIGARYQALVYCCDDACLSAVRRLGEDCYRAGITFLPGIVFRGHSLIGPLVRSGARGCWLCAALRYTNNLGPREASAFWMNVALGDGSIDSGSGVSVSTARILGNNVAFELFKEFTGCAAAESDGGLLSQDLETLESYVDPLRPHPLCGVCGGTDTRAQLGRLQEVVERRHDSAETTEELLGSWYKNLSPRLGVFKGFKDEEVEQTPLRTSLIKVGRPADTPSGELSIRAVSLDTTALARYAALVRAVERYSGESVDPRGLAHTSAARLRAAGETPVMPEELSLWSGGPTLHADAEAAWAPASALLSAGLCHLPAAAAYPHTSLNHSGIFEKTAAGSAAATRWDDLLLKALVSALGFERLTDVLRGRGRVRTLDGRPLVERDKDIAYLLKTAGRFGAEPELLELAGDSPVRVVLARGQGGTVRAEVGFAESLHGAATMALTNYVAARMDEGDDSVVDSPLADFALPPDCVIDPPWGGAEDGPATAEGIMRFFKASGREAFFVHTTPDDIWQTETFMTGKVLLSRPAAVTR